MPFNNHVVFDILLAASLNMTYSISETFGAAFLKFAALEVSFCF